MTNECEPRLSETPALPATLVRRCCRGKSCTTTLYLDSLEVQAGEGQEPLPALFRYLRQSNDNEFGPGWSTREALTAWVEESAAKEAADEAAFRRADEEDR